MGKCPNCGEWNHPKSTKCVKCGSSLRLSKSNRTSPKATVIERDSKKPSKSFWEENGHLIAHAAIKLLFG